MATKLNGGIIKGVLCAIALLGRKVAALPQNPYYDEDFTTIEEVSDYPANWPNPWVARSAPPIDDDSKILAEQAILTLTVTSTTGIPRSPETDIIPELTVRLPSLTLPTTYSAPSLPTLTILAKSSPSAILEPSFLRVVSPSLSISSSKSESPAPGVVKVTSFIVTSQLKITVIKLASTTLVSAYYSPVVSMSVSVLSNASTLSTLSTISTLSKISTTSQASQTMIPTRALLTCDLPEQTRTVRVPRLSNDTKIAMDSGSIKFRLVTSAYFPRGDTRFDNLTVQNPNNTIAVSNPILGSTITSGAQFNYDDSSSSLGLSCSKSNATLGLTMMRERDNNAYGLVLFSKGAGTPRLTWANDNQPSFLARMAKPSYNSSAASKIVWENDRFGSWLACKRQASGTIELMWWDIKSFPGIDTTACAKVDLLAVKVQESDGMVGC